MTDSIFGTGKGEKSPNRRNEDQTNSKSQTPKEETTRCDWLMGFLPGLDLFFRIEMQVLNLFEMGNLGFRIFSDMGAQQSQSTIQASIPDWIAKSGRSLPVNALNCDFS